MFSTRKPRGFQHNYMYVDERKERLKEIEERAKRELGMLPPKEFNPEDIRGTFVKGTKHLRRRVESGRKPMHWFTAVLIILALLYLWRYLLTGELRF